MLKRRKRDAAIRDEQWRKLAKTPLNMDVVEPESHDNLNKAYVGRLHRSPTGILEKPYASTPRVQDPHSHTVKSTNRANVGGSPTDLAPDHRFETT
eukprot:UN01062